MPLCISNVIPVNECKNWISYSRSVGLLIHTNTNTKKISTTVMEGIFTEKIAN